MACQCTGLLRLVGSGLTLWLIGSSGCARDNPRFGASGDAGGGGTASDGTAGDSTSEGGRTATASSSKGGTGDEGVSGEGDSGATSASVDPTGTTGGDTGTAGPIDTGTTVDVNDVTDSGGETSSGLACVDSVVCEIGVDDPCGNGERCQPLAFSGDSGFDVAVCRPLADNVGMPGDECAFSVCEGDDCDVGSVCVVGPGGVAGVCQSLCNLGTGQVCESPDQACVPAGAFQVCRMMCDPLLQDCNGPTGCYVVGDVPVCMPDTSGGAVLEFDECTGDYTQTCAAGLDCIQGVNGCAGPQCCAHFCGVGDTDCPADYECVSLSLGPGYETVGYCEPN